MSYSIVDDLKKKIDELALIQLTDTGGTGRVDSEKIDRAIRDADATIDSFVSKVYKTPLGPVPHIIIDISATLAIWNLHMFRSMESSVWKEAHANSISLLEKVSSGEATLEGAVTEPASSDNSSGSGFTSADRRFSRDSLKGM